MTFLLGILTWVVNWARKNKTAAILAGIVAILVFVLLFQSFCGGRRVETLNEAEVLKAQEAVKTGNDEALREVLVGVEIREKAIDAAVTNAGAHSANAEAASVNAYHEARRKWANANISEMQAEIDRRHP